MRTGTSEEAEWAMAALNARFRTIDVPLALLLSGDLTPAAKFLWIRLLFDEAHVRMRSHIPERLAKRTCLARSTIYEALNKAAATGWIVPYRDPVSEKRRWRTACPVKDRRGVVKIPVDLIRASHAVRPQAILCYGLLQATPDFNGITGEFKWADLRTLTGLHLRTLKRAVRALADARWIATAQKNRIAPIWFRLQHADEAFKDEIRQSMVKSGFRGEAIMRTYLSLSIATNEAEDNARPVFLVNPATGERMELDRYYPLDRVAFEFNGPQHYKATGRFTKQEVATQRKRDAHKRRICKENGVALVVVHAEDLSLRTMLKKVGDMLPRRGLRGFKQTMQFLKACSLGYQRAAQSG